MRPCGCWAQCDPLPLSISSHLLPPPHSRADEDSADISERDQGTTLWATRWVCRLPVRTCPGPQRHPLTAHAHPPTPHPAAGFLLHGTMVVISSTARVNPAHLPAGHGTSADGTLHHYAWDDIWTGAQEDGAAVMVILDAVLADIRLGFPDVRQVFLVSDRGPCYAGAGFALCIPFTTDLHGLHLRHFVHPGPGQGKLGVVRDSSCPGTT